MNDNGDLAQQWLKKAESDYANAELCLSGAVALDTATFHCQQAAEKFLKAWLIAHDIDPPKTHEMKHLIALCLPIDPRFDQLSSDADALTPYAVERRYDSKFWPSLDEVRAALEKAHRIRDFVKAHWPK